MTIQITVENLLQQHYGRVPEPLKQPFDIERDLVKDGIKQLLKDGERNLENAVKKAVNNWISNQLIGMTYKRYKARFQHCITFEEFKVGATNPDPTGINPWKRFTHIERENLKVGDEVIENKTGKVYKIAGISPKVMLHLDRLHEPQNPLNFTKKQ